MFDNEEVVGDLQITFIDSFTNPVCHVLANNLVSNLRIVVKEAWNCVWGTEREV